MPNDVEKNRQFLELFIQNTRRIYAYLYMLLGNSTDADDVFQETSRVLWEKFHEFVPGTDFLAWAESVAHYQTLSFRRRHQRDRLQFSLEFIEAVVDARNHTREGLEQRQRALDDCLQKLRPADQQLIRLRYSDGATTRSVAQQVARSVDAVYKALNRIETFLIDCTRRALRSEDQPSLGGV
jgi:RNA polymerase sigma-70 factor (ECF subfamily)